VELLLAVAVLIVAETVTQAFIWLCSMLYWVS